MSCVVYFDSLKTKKKGMVYMLGKQYADKLVGRSSPDYLSVVAIDLDICENVTLDINNKLGHPHVMFRFKNKETGKKCQVPLSIIDTNVHPSYYSKLRADLKWEIDGRLMLRKKGDKVDESNYVHLCEYSYIKENSN